MNGPEESEERGNPCHNQGQVGSLTALLQLCPREREHRGKQGGASPACGAAFTGCARQENGMDDTAAEEGVDARSDVRLHKEEEDLFERDVEEGGADDRGLGVRPNLRKPREDERRS